MNAPESLKRALDGFLETLPGIQGVAGLGFVEPNRALVEKALKLLGKDAHRQLIDLSKPGAFDAVPTAFAVGAPLVLLTTPAVTPNLATFVRTVLEKMPHWQWGVHKLQPRADQLVVLLLDGAGQLEDVPATLRETPYWSFL